MPPEEQPVVLWDLGNSPGDQLNNVSEVPKEEE